MLILSCLIGGKEINILQKSIVFKQSLKKKKK